MNYKSFKIGSYFLITLYKLWKSFEQILGGY